MIKEFTIVLILFGFVTGWFGGIVYYYDSSTTTHDQSYAEKHFKTTTYLLKKYEMASQESAPEKASKDAGRDDLVSLQNE